MFGTGEGFGGWGGRDERDWASDSDGLESSTRSKRNTAAAMDRWVDEQMFEEDVRAVLRMMRPNRRERLMGWNEHRTGGAHFRATISWDDKVPDDEIFSIPNLAEVLESILVGSIKSEAELTGEEECAAYRQVLRELSHRVDEFAERFS
ncbi:MAG TPA: hypothetical protein VH475_20815 [Tepidisphaeraceae bacterium]|jgi:hypothetical protein